MQASWRGGASNFMGANVFREACRTRNVMCPIELAIRRRDSYDTEQGIGIPNYEGDKAT